MLEVEVEITPHSVTMLSNIQAFTLHKCYPYNVYNASFPVGSLRAVSLDHSCFTHLCILHSFNMFLKDSLDN